MSIVAIVNPISGARARRSHAAARVAMLRAAAVQRGVDLDVHLTEGAGHARELAGRSAAAGATLIIAWGGDGTLNEVGSALIGSATAIGIIPAGSGNGLAAALQVPRDPAAAIAAAFDGRTRTIDAGLLAGRPFFNVAGIGFDAHVARLFNEQPLGRRGAWPYLAIGVREGWRYRAREYTVELDSVPVTIRALLIAFANGGEYGLGAKIAPAALLDDGHLDAVIVADRSAPVRFWHARHLAMGTPHRAAFVMAKTIVRATVSSDGPIEFHVDGEAGVAEGMVEVRIVPAALRVRVEGQR